VLPIPPIELRRAVGPTDPAAFDNPKGRDAIDLDVQIPGRPAIDYSSVLDFGCGCGRLARKMMQQKTPPGEYVGLDLNRSHVDWASQNLSPHHPQFSFRHLDYYNMGFNPNGSRQPPPLPVPSSHFTFAVASSVFTHIVENDVEFFFAECARALAKDGLLWSTWFVFDKCFFPAMQVFQNALYINLGDPSNAVWYDMEFITRLHENHGMHICAIGSPLIRGFQWHLLARKAEGKSMAFPDDLAPFGIARPPVNLETGGERAIS